MGTISDFISDLTLAGAMCAVRHGPAAGFTRATRDPMKHQEELLLRILKANVRTEFGHSHGFASIDGIEAYRRRVPISSYADMKPYIDRQCRTGARSLTEETPVMYCRTSGTTGEPKLVPVTRAGLTEMRRVQRLFAHAQYSGSSFYSGRVLAVVGPASEGEVGNGMMYGSATGRIYATMPRLVRSKYVIPPELFSIGDYDTKYYLIVALGLRERNITGLAAANPSTLLKLIETIRHEWHRLLADIANGDSVVLKRLRSSERQAFLSRFVAHPDRARELANINRPSETITFADIWPRLGGVMTWTSGSCGFALHALAGQWPAQTRIMEAGYVSSEFWGSINLDVARGICVPAFTSCFLEFVERRAWEQGEGEFRTLARLEAGKQYYVFVTTLNGLYRYDMNDIVTVTGWMNATPTIAFVQKGRGVTNITGEKISESQIARAVEIVQRDRGFSAPFFVALADEEASRYLLYVEAGRLEAGTLGAIETSIDGRLAELNIEYRDKRASGRLRPLKLFVLRQGSSDLYRKACVARGQSDAQFKALLLQYRRECLFDFDRQRLQGEYA